MSTQQQKRPATNGANKPVHTVRHRSIKATIWKNETSNGPMYNVTVVRSYRVEGQPQHWLRRPDERRSADVRSARVHFVAPRQGERGEKRSRTTRAVARA